MDDRDGATGSTANDNLDCSTCGKHLSSYSSLLDHQRTHTGERPHGCQICGKRFTQKAHLIIHKRTHTGEKPYACHICHKRFAQSSHLKNHKRIHTGEKAYFCSLCNTGFNKKPRLEAHLQDHVLKGDIPSTALANIDMTMRSEKSDLWEGDFSSTDLQAAATLLSGMASLAEGSMATGYRGLPSSQPPLGESPERNDNADAGDDLGNKRKRKQDVVTRVLQYGEKTSEDEGVLSKVIKTEDIDEDDDDDDDLDTTNEDNIKDDDTDSPDISETGHDGYLKPSDGLDDCGLSALNEMLKTAQGQVDSKIDDSGSVCAVSSTDPQANGQLDETDRASNVSEENNSTSELAASAIQTYSPSIMQYQKLLNMNLRSRQKTTVTKAGVAGREYSPFTASSLSSSSSKVGASCLPLVRANNRICLVDFTTEDLITHLLARDNVYRCDYCAIIFQDAAMYHLHRSMHDKMDIRCCNLCGKLSVDKYDFLAHFLTEHKN